MIWRPKNRRRDAERGLRWGRVMKDDPSAAFRPHPVRTTPLCPSNLVTRVHVSRAGPPKIKTFVDLPITVVVQAIADLCSTGMDRGVVVVAISLTLSKSVPIVLLRENVPTSAPERQGNTSATPDDHGTARPDGRVAKATRGSVVGRRRDPAVRDGVVPTARSEFRPGVTAPDDHEGSRPYGGVVSAARRSVGRGRRGPGIGGGVVPAAGVKIRAAVPTPDNHETSCPDCGVVIATRRSVGHG